MLKRLLLALSLPLSLAVVPAAASVITEADGAFSRHWDRPTTIGAGVNAIVGTLERQNDRDMLALVGLPAGQQTLTFSFLAPDWAHASYSFSAGGQVLWSETPFEHEWDGAGVGSFQLSRWTPESGLELILGNGFQGPLYLAIYFTHGSDVTWSLNAGGVSASEPAPILAAVPLTGAGSYAAGGLSILAALGLWSGARRREGG